MKIIRSDLALQRILDALEADLLAATAEEVQAIVAETGMSADALLADRGAPQRPSHNHEAGGDSTPHPDLRSDLPLKGGGA
jgi:hypothetical protein